MKKIILLFAMIAVAFSAQATTDKLYATWGSAGNGTYNAGTSTYTWTASTNNLVSIFTFAAGELANYEKLTFTLASLSDGGVVRLNFEFRGGSNATYSTTWNANGTIDLTKENLTTFLTSQTKSFADVQSIRFGGNTASGSVKVTDVYLETKEYSSYETMTITTTLSSSTNHATPFQWYTYDGSTKTSKGTGDLYRNQFGTAGIKEILSDAGANLGYGNGFFDITGYDNVTVNITTYDNTKADQIRLLAATGSTSTTNFNIDVTQQGATTKSLSGLATSWIAGIYSKSGNDQSQDITSVAFTKSYKTAPMPFTIAASDNSSVSYDRTFVKGRKSTVCLPFSLTAEEAEDAGTFYKLTAYDGSTLTFSDVTSEGTKAYKPYLFVAKETGKPFNTAYTNKVITDPSAAETSFEVGSTYTATMTGTLVYQSLESGVYGWNSSDGTFSKTNTGNVTINAFRAYISVSGVSGAREIRCDFGDEITGINDVKSQKKVEDDVLYNLSGQRVSPNHKGIVIKNGRKYMQY